MNDTEKILNEFAEFNDFKDFDELTHELFTKFEFVAKLSMSLWTLGDKKAPLPAVQLRDEDTGKKYMVSVAIQEVEENDS